MAPNGPMAAGGRRGLFRLAASGDAFAAARVHAHGPVVVDATLRGRAARGAARALTHVADPRLVHHFRRAAVVARFRRVEMLTVADCAVLGQLVGATHTLPMAAWQQWRPQHTTGSMSSRRHTMQVSVASMLNRQTSKERGGLETASTKPWRRLSGTARCVVGTTRLEARSVRLEARSGTEQSQDRIKADGSAHHSRPALTLRLILQHLRTLPP